MIGGPGQDRRRAVKLFGQHHPHQHVRPDHAAKGQKHIRPVAQGGRDAIRAATGRNPQWYRGATGRYDAGGMSAVRGLGEAVAGYSIRADDGASLPAAAVARRIEGAKDGDVIIAHANKPDHSSGAGVVTGMLALKARGYVFVKLGAPPRPAPQRGS